MNKCAIVAIGYNRKKSIERLLNSVSAANYEGDKVDLIISIDKSDNPEVETFAAEYEWEYGEKIVRTFTERQGLRKHVLSCGDYFEYYDYLIILEDDLWVSENYYSFAKRAVEYYQSDDKIAGISLYSHLWNVNALQNFIPENSPYDVYFLQFAQSWGQVWMKEVWNRFMEWYDENKDINLSALDFPAHISSWSDSSWLKYHIKFCVETDRYFVYPYVSLSTCFADIGEHQKIKNTVFQVPLQYGCKKDFKFCPFGEDSVKYDAFFERVGMKIKDISSKICIDLYGTKPLEYICSGEYEYCITSKVLKGVKPIKKYGLNMRPHEENIVLNVDGNELFLYKIDNKNISETKLTLEQETDRYLYYQKINSTFHRAIGVLSSKIKEKMFRG